MSSRTWTVGRYLVERLHQVGVGTVFGVPGDYVLGFMDEIVASPLELVGTCNELNAGYAADAYARINGVGAVCVTYAVGGFSVLNAIAGAYAERVPVIVISGGPNRSDRELRRLMHHTLGDYDVQVEVFEHVTEFAVLLGDAVRVPEQIPQTAPWRLIRRRLVRRLLSGGAENAAHFVYPQIVDGFVAGYRNMTIGAIVLGLAVTLGFVARELHTADYVVGLIGQSLAPM